MRKLSYRDSLVFYDGLQVFIAEDQFGTKYVCTLIEQTEAFDKYLCSPVSNSRLTSLLEGSLELRLIYVDPESDEMLVIESQDGELQGLPARTLTRQQILPDWLPQSGFFLHFEKPPNVEVVQEAHNRSRAIIHCRLDPPEARNETKISAENLSQATKLIQRLVKHAFRRAVRGLDKEIRDAMTLPENYQLEVFAFSPGSFTLHMQSAAPADLVGYVQVSKALEIVDKVTALATTPDETVNQVSQLGGHFATAYKDLLKFISDTESHLEYEWAVPEKQTTTRRRISSVQAKPLYEALIQRTDIGKEMVRLVGKLTKVDEKLRTWRLVNEEDSREYNGAVEVELAGLIIETQRYEFFCEERLEEERGSGKEFTRLFLINYHPL